jgi:thioesterase domain-containing protein
MSELMTRALDLEARIDKLSDRQRAALTHRLAELTGRRGGERSEGTALAAFVTIDAEPDGPTPTPAELRGHLQGLVPAHMVPSSIRVVDEIPRLPNGKVDTNALAHLPDGAIESETEWVPPRNDVERKLAAIWCDVLQVDQIGVHDPFFEVGGDSILSIHVTSRANQQGLGLSPNDIFNFPTIAQLAARCGRRHAEPSELPQGPEPTDRTSDPTRSGGLNPLPLFMVQWGAKEAAQLRQHLGPDQPLYSFGAHWHGAHLSLDATIEEMAEERLAELRSLQPSGPYFIGGYSMGVPIALEMAQRLLRQGEQVPMLFVLDPPYRNRREEALVHGPPKTLAQKLRIQFRALLEEPPAGWLRHLATEIRAQLRHRVLEPMKLARVGAMRRIGLDVPETLWHHYVGSIYLRARGRYVHAPYDGDVVIFSGGSDVAAETLSSWRELVRGDLHVEAFEATHLDFTTDAELFTRWAQRLTALLGERQLGPRLTATDPPSDSLKRRSVHRTTVEPLSTASAAR